MHAFSATALEVPPKFSLSRWDRETTCAHLFLTGLTSVVYRALLLSYIECRSWQEAKDWKYRTADAITALFGNEDHDGSSDLEGRIPCPLCRHDPLHVSVPCFTGPEDFRRHLFGWGEQELCQIFSAAVLLAARHWQERFELWEKTQPISETEFEGRQENEGNLYFWDPRHEPCRLNQAGRRPGSGLLGVPIYVSGSETALKIPVERTRGTIRTLPCKRAAR